MSASPRSANGAAGPLPLRSAPCCRARPSRRASEGRGRSRAAAKDGSTRRASQVAPRSGSSRSWSTRRTGSALAKAGSSPRSATPCRVLYQGQAGTAWRAGTRCVVDVGDASPPNRLPPGALLVEAQMHGEGSAANTSRDAFEQSAAKRDITGPRTSPRLQPALTTTGLYV